jgi:hypothetical protein
LNEGLKGMYRGYYVLRNGETIGVVTWKDRKEGGLKYYATVQHTYIIPVMRIVVCTHCGGYTSNILYYIHAFIFMYGVP